MTSRVRPIPGSPPEPLRHVHQPLAHDSAHRHVQGSAAYIDDQREPEGTLHMACGLSPKARGRITLLDLVDVLAYPGVVAVLTADDVPGINDVSPSIGGDPLFAAETVAFHAQVLFAVIADTRDAARRAARLAKVEIEAEEPSITVEQAAARGETVLPDYAFTRGDIEAGLAASARTVSGSFRIGGQEHFYLEGQAALAIPKEDGEILVHSSTQHPSEVQHICAKILGLPDAFVICEVRRMGGGFGGKESQATQWAAMAALAAWKLKRPCKIRLDRDDDFATTGKRHDFRADYRIGFDDEGVISAYDVDYHARCGYSADLSLGVIDRCMFHSDSSYWLPITRINTRRWMTNTVSNTAFRGFGGPQGMLMAERMIDEIAWALGKDPLDVRQANFYRPGKDVTPYGRKVTELETMHALIKALEESSGYRGRREEVRAFNAGSRFIKRGLALTPVKFGISFTLKQLNQAGALVHVYQDGSIQLNHGGTEMGQGLYQKVAQVVAEEFGVDIARVRITATTTEKVPNTGPTAASSGTDLNARAALNAAKAIKDRMAGYAASLWGCPASNVVFRDDRVFAGNESLAFGELAKKAHLDRIHLSQTGFFATPGITWDRATKSGNPFLYFAFGAACAEVEIDTLTGENRVRRVDILHDVGKSLNPAIDIGQIEGGFVQGVGWLTTEELVFAPDGKLLTHAPATYKIPVASDIPEDFRVALYPNSNQADVVYASKAVGEPPVMLANAVFCALADAVHALNPAVRVPLDAPATPEAILRACEAVKGSPMAGERL